MQLEESESDDQSSELVKYFALTSTISYPATDYLILEITINVYRHIQDPPENGNVMAIRQLHATSLQFQYLQQYAKASSYMCNAFHIVLMCIAYSGMSQ